MSLLQEMVLFVSEVKGIRTKNIYESYTKQELLIEYTYLINKRHKEVMSQLNDKEKAKHPDRFVDVVPMQKEDYWVFIPEIVNIKVNEILNG